MLYCILGLPFVLYPKELSFAIALCIQKYSFTCCDLTDDERRVRNIFYLIIIMLYIAVFYILIISLTYSNSNAQKAHMTIYNKSANAFKLKRLLTKKENQFLVFHKLPIAAGSTHMHQ